MLALTFEAVASRTVPVVDGRAIGSVEMRDRPVGVARALMGVVTLSAAVEMESGVMRRGYTALWDCVGRNAGRVDLLNEG